MFKIISRSDYQALEESLEDSLRREESWKRRIDSVVKENIQLGKRIEELVDAITTIEKLAANTGIKAPTSRSQEDYEAGKDIINRSF